MTGHLEETVSAARAGDAAALETLFARTMPRLIAFLRVKMGRLVGVRESARDLAQSVCREVLQDMDGFVYQGDDAFTKWLFVQATRKIVDRHRYLTRERRDAARDVDLAADSDVDSVLASYATFCTPSQVASGREELMRIEGAIDELPDKQRDAVGMSRLMGLGYAEIAEHLDCTEAAARGLVARGLAKLALLLLE